MKLSNVLLGLTGCFFAASLSGCFFVASDDPSTVSITVALSIDGHTSTAACDDFRIDALNVEIIKDGRSIISSDTDCYNMGMTIDNLAPGRYTVEASLLEGNTIASDIVAVDNTPVTRNTDSLVKIDFPAHFIH